MSFVQNMNEIIPNLWLGDISSLHNTAELREKNIHSILSAMRGKVVVAETFNRLQISIDDTEEEDILKHLVVAISFIHAELEKGRGVLVHCLAGISRSASLVAAYLMYSQGLSPEDALAAIRKARPIAEPNDGFLAQLKIFHKASCVVSVHDKATRMFYLERMVKNIINGEGELDANLLAVPSSAGASPPSGTTEGRRRIRCKMCRQELATRENMQDHGQLSPPSPAVSYSPIIPSPSPLAGFSNAVAPIDILEKADGIKHNVDTSVIDEAEELGRQLSEHLTVSESGDEHANAESRQSTESKKAGPTDSNIPPAGSANQGARVIETAPATNARPPVQRPVKTTSTAFAHPSDLSAQLYNNPALAALRPGLNVVPAPSPSLLVPSRATALSSSRVVPSSPTLINPKCSGYFVEPLKWMEPFLEQGHQAGKIICPNKKCKAKLGNYDWAGVCCSCKEWVIPGFCIHRSKVDEVV